MIIFNLLYKCSGPYFSRAAAKSSTKRNFELDRQKQTTQTHTHEVFRQKRKREGAKKAVFERARPAGVCCREEGKITQNYFFRTTETSERAADAAQNSHTRSWFSFFPFVISDLKIHSNTFDFKQQKYVENGGTNSGRFLYLFTLFSPLKKVTKHTHTHLPQPFIF